MLLQLHLLLLSAVWPVCSACAVTEQLAHWGLSSWAPMTCTKPSDVFGKVLSRSLDSHLLRVSNAELYDVKMDSLYSACSQCETLMRRSRTTLYVCILVSVCVVCALQNMNILSQLMAIPSGAEQRAVSTATRVSQGGSLRKIPNGR